jgi:hypothetical protein
MKMLSPNMVSMVMTHVDGHLCQTFTVLSAGPPIGAGLLPPEDVKVVDVRCISAYGVPEKKGSDHGQ